LKKREVLVHGDNLKEAHMVVQNLLEEHESIMHTEILTKGRRGFWGFFRKPATIKVIINAGQSRGYQKQQEREQDGMAEISEGVLKVYGPSGGRKKAVIIPAAGAILRVNGVPTRGSRQVGEDEEVEVELIKNIGEAKLEVEISKDNLIAGVRITPQITIFHQLVDQSRQNVLQLITHQQKIEKRVITFTEVEEALQAYGVSFGIDHNEIQKAIAAADGDWWVVARGQPVHQGKDGFVEYMFQCEPVEIKYGEEEWVNYWERYTFPGVREGEVLAVLHPAQEGLPGKDVTGKDILPKPIKEAYLQVKDGVKISDDGCKAIATISGRPVLEGYRKKYIKIVKCMIHPGDVDIKSGNLRFEGDLMILGNVKETMQVAAYGEITIMGNAADAVIQAGGKIFCRGKFFGSKVRAGGLTSFYNRVSKLLDKLDEILDWIMKESIRVREYSLHENKLDEVYLNEIVVYLIDYKKAELEKLLNEYISIIEEQDIPFPSTIKDLVPAIKNLISSRWRKDISIYDEVNSIREKNQNITKILEAIPEEACDIYCSYAQGSILETNCNIIVGGQGCYQSSLIAGKQIRVNGTFRGGEMLANQDILVDEAGSEGMSAGKIKIKTSDKAIVTLNKVHPETIVRLGNQSYLFEEEMERVKMYVGVEGKIKINNLTSGGVSHRMSSTRVQGKAPN